MTEFNITVLGDVFELKCECGWKHMMYGFKESQRYAVKGGTDYITSIKCQKCGNQHMVDYSNVLFINPETFMLDALIDQNNSLKRVIKGIEESINKIY